ncbi:putative hydrolase of the HAD superfamily [Klenkia soli]|uniref:Putative hydrolase of the HAD superfamily n=1 Tax=Klenkia soli TaxID=1052260 RepID=A0A1H0MXL9_9ACTN|nr:HAD-IA family hydrolase [Klenkia soli]SDO85147.1 putative hydrolase of the HAD superfamily [Klenkia soli]
MTAVVLDLGGVISTSPLAAFGDYERSAGLPLGLVARLNTTNPHTNAWARFERSELDRAGFVEVFEAEARAAGYDVDATRVLAALHGALRPEVVHAIRALRTAGVPLALLTNNAAPMDPASEHGSLVELFDVVVESSVEGVRKPEPAIYPLTLERLSAAVGRTIDHAEVVYLDDLGPNLKPARELGWHTVKVVDPADALAELARVTGVDLS